MQPYKLDDVIKSVCEKKNLNPELMKSFSDFIFSSTKKEMQNFSNLRIYLKGFVTWFYGKTRLEQFFPKIEEKLSHIENETKGRRRSAFIETRTPEQLKEVYDKTENLLSLYKDYIEEKKTVKTKYKEDRANEYKRKV